ncbi:PD-(D/E)XK nuclease family protein [Halobacteriovorax sp.]|uniref:PDDEXK-like family protein n=1 Tax=Halobacteriovorax sp. TaxID=2020862 RepID=UPI003AF2D8DE
MDKDNLTHKEMLKYLDDFLVNSADLDTLTDRLNRFNIFNVLKISEMEIRHSNTLGWLLDPNESHKLGDKFLRRFLSGAILHAEDVDLDLRAAAVELMDFYNIEVRREYRDIDVLVVDNTNNLVTVIENKINSKESRGQLDKYNKVIDEEFPTYQKVKIYLTVDGEDPSDHAQSLGYFPFSHLEVLQILQPLLEANRTNIPDEPYIFINHYLDTLRILTMEDKEVIELCRKIYKKHRVAIDLINQFATSTNFNDEAFEVVKEAIPDGIRSKAWARLYFLTPKLNELLPQYGGENYYSFLRETPMVIWFKRSKKKDKCMMGIEVGDFPEYAKRKKFLDHLVSLGFDIKQQSYKEDSRISRVKTYTVNFDEENNGDDANIVKACFEKLYKKAKADIEKIETSLEFYEW